MATQPDEHKPTIVLVHGAWADATGFDAEIRALQREGFRAIGFANPLRDLAGDSTDLAEFLRTLTGPIVLVGHSYGGNVISTAATGNDQVKALVYLNTSRSYRSPTPRPSSSFRPSRRPCPRRVAPRSPTHTVTSRLPLGTVTHSAANGATDLPATVASRQTRNSASQPR
jgi:pimeloyl-ACP methyl ester carboxylesterase